MHLSIFLPIALVVWWSSTTFVEYIARPAYPVPAPGSAILITGARSGIGLSAAKRLSKEGFFVFASTRTAQAAEAISAMHISNMVGVKLDLLSEEDMVQVEQMIRQWCAKTGNRFAGVVHNGIAIGKSGFVELTRLEEAKTFHASGLEAVRLLTQKLLPLIRAHHGRVVGISSFAQLVPMPGGSAYSETKAALAMFLNCLRLELYPAGCAVVNIAPGAISTGLMTETHVRKWFDEIYSPPALNEAYPFYAAKAKESVDKMITTTTFAWQTTDKGSTDDLILEAFSSPRPPFTVFPGSFGIPAKLLAQVLSYLPESVVFRLLTEM